MSSLKTSALDQSEELNHFPELGKRIALVAGSGQFPIDFARKMRASGRGVAVIAFEGEADPEIELLADLGMHWIKVGQLSKLLKIIKKSKVSHLAFAGGVSRVKLFRNAWPDFKALALAARLGTIKDDVLLRAVAAEVEKLGVTVINGATYLDQAVPRRGLMTTRDLTQDEVADALIGWKAAKLIGSAEIGQSVIVYKSLVIAVEAVEGTDQTIRRAGVLTNLAEQKRSHSGAVLVKVCKPHQDKRLDLPTFGPQTIKEMVEAGLTAAIVEAEATLLIDPINLVLSANKNGIALFAAQNESDLIPAGSRERDFSLQ